MRFVTSLAVAISAIALLPLAAYGANPCQADAKKLCPGMKPGSGAAIACLKEHEAEVSPACKEKIATAKAKADAFKQACGADAEKFCPGVKRGHGALAKCLAGHEAELSPACQQQVAGAREKVANFKKACGADAKKLCPGVKPGEGKLFECLKTNEAQLSPACQAAMPK